MAYSWLTKHRARVTFRSFLDGKLIKEYTEMRMVYPPKPGKLGCNDIDRVYPSINWLGGRRTVVPNGDSGFLVETHITRVAKI